MAVRHRIQWLIIHTVYCVAIVQSTLLDINDAKSCDLLCAQCNASAVFAHDRCECNSSDNSDKGVECIQRIQREIQTIDLNTLSEDLTDEERAVRSIVTSRRRLRMGDADKVAQYFINGGPAVGHSHFIKAFNAAYDSTDSATNSFSGILDGNRPENEFYGEKPLNNAISWNTYNSPLYMVSEAGPCVHPVVSGVETPIVGMINPALSYPANEVYATNPLVGSIIHPYRHGLPLHHTLHRFPGQILSNLFGHRRAVYHHPVYHGGFRSSNNINPVSASQSTGENDSSAAFKDFPIARSNTDKSIDQNIVENPTYMLNANPVYPPRQYQLFSTPYQYTSYHNPLINVLHPVTDGYIVQPEYIPQYMHDTSDPLISALNPNSYCTNNINAEQKNEISTVNVHSNNEAEQSNNAIKNKENNKTEKNENNKS
ncbi:uncharacterized protein LOC126853987 isoform X1 [Cataglyphis hispanica]|uniref:uncharacterized protein LOC126853987 isoform X1 n=1 Tax=Cataglyphis hispanica TaxID=1086592 RepID=UPI00217FEB62|nr:uncharacterized protein LOC126853987 isoform X1 [Cataglyphis hispanica]